MADFTKLNGYTVKDPQAVHTYDTVADLKADTKLKAGNHVSTKGYTAINDGGGSSYYIRTKVIGETIDDGSTHELSNGLVAELIVNKTINVLQFGYTEETITYNEENTIVVKNITNSIRNAINYLETVSADNHETFGVNIYIPNGSFYINESIDLNSYSVHLVGDNPIWGTVAYQSYNHKQKILTNVDNDYVFKNGKIYITGLTFENIVIYDSSKNAKFATGDRIEIDKCHIGNYDIVVDSLGGVSITQSSYILECRKAFVKGTCSDAIITNNYINGSLNYKDVVAFDCTSFSTTVLSNNYIDFFHDAVKTTSVTTGSRIIGNIFDYCYCAINITGVTNTSIVGNTFIHCRKSEANRWNYTSDEAEYSNDWTCIETGYTVKGVTITGNNAIDCDLFFNAKNIASDYLINLSGNAVNANTKYINTIRNNAKCINYKIHDLDNTEYTVEPVASNTYLGQRVYYNGIIYRNLDNTIVAVGVKGYEGGVAKSYTTTGDGNITIDLTNLPSGYARSNLIFEVRTAQGYLTPHTMTYRVIRIGNNLSLIPIQDDTLSTFKPTVTSSGLSLSVTMSGTYEEGTASKQITYRFYEG